MSKAELPKGKLTSYIKAEDDYKEAKSELLKAKAKAEATWLALTQSGEELARQYNLKNDKVHLIEYFPGMFCRAYHGTGDDGTWGWHFQPIDPIKGY